MTCCLVPGAWPQAVESKGLDIVRRDWCGLSKDAGNYVLKEASSAGITGRLAAACCMVHVLRHMNTCRCGVEWFLCLPPLCRTQMGLDHAWSSS